MPPRIGAGLRTPDWSVGSRWRALILVALPLLGIPILLSAIDPGATVPWQPIHLTLAAILGLVIAGLGCRNLTGRYRSVRGWIAFAFAAWLGIVLLRDLERTALLAGGPLGPGSTPGPPAPPAAPKRGRKTVAKAGTV